MHSIEFKIAMYITDHRRTNPIYFGEYRMKRFFLFRSTKKISYTLQTMESNYKKYASIQMVLSIKLKFDMCIVDQHSLYYINFTMSRTYSFFFLGYIKCPIGIKYLFHLMIVKWLESVQN